MTEIPPPAWIPTNAEYHAVTWRWSSSMVRDFIKSPALAYGRYVLKDVGGHSGSTSTRIGSAVGLMLSDRTEDLRVARCRTASSAAFRALAERYPSHTVITESENEKAEIMRDQILHPTTNAAVIARRLMVEAEGFDEYAHVWTDSSGVECKVMADRVILDYDGKVAGVEFKTAKDPSPSGMRRAGQIYRYDLQIAHNVRGLTDALGHPPERYWIVTVRNEEPFEVGVMTAGQSYFDSSRELDRGLAALARALSNNQWCASWESLDRDGQETGVPVLERPTWAQNDGGEE